MIVVKLCGTMDSHRDAKISDVIIIIGCTPSLD